MPGVLAVVDMPHGLAVVAQTHDQAEKALKTIDISLEPDPRTNPLQDDYVRVLQSALSGPVLTIKNQENSEQALNLADRIVEARYELPLLAHASLETPAATARIGEDGLDVLAPTQKQERALNRGSEISGLPEDRVRIHTLFPGGSFGRNLETDAVEEAVFLDQHTGWPIQVRWTRSQDLGHDWYRPASVHQLKAGLDPQGRLTVLTHAIAAPSILKQQAQGTDMAPHDRTSVEGSHDQAYQIPNHRVSLAPTELGVPLGFWRSVGHSFNAFVLGSMLNEAALAGGIDPLEFRLNLLGDQLRHRTVLKKTAMAAGWGRPFPPGRGMGLALHESYGSLAAMFVEVRLEHDNRLKVVRVVCGIDCGRAIQPDLIQAQVEGGVAFGLTAAMFGEITLTRGRVNQKNFKDYPMLRLARMPEVETLIIDGQGPLGGAGEPPVAVVAPALIGFFLRPAAKESDVRH